MGFNWVGTRNFFLENTVVLNACVRRHHGKSSRLLQTQFKTPVICGCQRVRDDLPNCLFLIEIRSVFKNIMNNLISFKKFCLL